MLLLLLAMAARPVVPAQADPPPALSPREGQIFPDLGFPRLLADGRLTPELHRLSEWRGQKVLLIQFASW